MKRLVKKCENCMKKEESKLSLLGKEMATEILKKVSQTTGIKSNDILNGKRKASVIQARILYANILMKKGAHVSEMSEFIPKDRSTFYHYLERHADMMNGFTDYDKYYQHLYFLTTSLVDTNERNSLLIIQSYLKDDRIDLVKRYVNQRLNS